MPLVPADRSSNVDGIPSQPRLVGWKEIAAYFDKAERTVKRWERDRNLPVYRVPGGSSASVYAYPAELKKWLEADPSGKSEIEATAQVAVKTIQRTHTKCRLWMLPRQAVPARQRGHIG